MNETPAATPRVHAGCGHLCLTCGAKAARQWLSAPPSKAFRRLTHVLYYVALASPVVSGAYAGGWFGSKPDAHADGKPLPLTGGTLTGQSLSYGDGRAVDLSSHMGTWQRVTTTLDAGGGMLTTYTLVADEMGVARMDVSPGKTCMCSRGSYCAVSSGRVTVVGAEPGSVIHVGCW